MTDLGTSCSMFSLCVVLVLALFPAQRFHRTTEHFRAPEMKHAVERNLVLEQAKSDAEQRIEESDFQPGWFLSDIRNVAKWLVAETPGPIRSARPIPVTFLMHRLKLGRSPSKAPDPLI
jgi:hypothetical protein